MLDSTVTYLTYDQWTPIMEWDSNGTLVATNVFGLGDDEILYRSAGSAQLFYKSDPMGNVKFLLNSGGTPIEKYVYDAFGKATITQLNGSPATGQRFMFSGREFFSTLAIYDLRNRMYDPALGSFLQIDPIGFEGDPSNMFRFCGNNPLMGGDPSGLGFLGVDWGGVGSNIVGGLSKAWDGFSSAYSSASSFIYSNVNFGWNEGHSSDYDQAISDGVDFNPLGFANDSPISFSGNLPWGYLATDTGFGHSSSFSTGETGFSITTGVQAQSKGAGRPSTFFTRRPDFYQLSGAVPLALVFPNPVLVFVGPRGSLSVDRYGHVYFALGGGGGFPANAGAQFTVNRVFSWATPTSEEMHDILTGHSFDVGGAGLYGIAGNVSCTPGSAWTIGAGFGAKGYGGGYTYGWEIWKPRFKKK